MVRYSNYAVAMLLLLSYLVPYLPPKHFGYFSVLGILTPMLLLLNFLFAVYWLIRWRQLILISGVALCLGLSSVGLWVQPFGRNEETKGTDNLKILSFNVRLFNHYHWHPDKELYKRISSFFASEAPDIILLQEFYNLPTYYPKGYPYKAVVLKNQRHKIGLAIFSKKKITDWGSLQFQHTANNGMYADVLINKDTIRLYNLHLESLHVSAKEEDLLRENTEQLMENISKRFARQQEQVEQFLAHRAQCKHKMIVCGDFNNTAYSYVYRKVRGDKLNDAFQEAGKGFGRSFNFFYPFRIDFILPDKSFRVRSFKTHYLPLSDHFALTTNLSNLGN